jgi:hypothetical protein
MASHPGHRTGATEWLLDTAMALGIEIDPVEADRWIQATSDAPREPGVEDGSLETEAIPPAQRLGMEMRADAITAYIERLTDEVHAYTVDEPDYGKAARRMYTIFRITGRDEEAAYIREMLDEPVTALYDVTALLRTLDAAANAGDAFETDAMVTQVDQLIMSAIRALDGPSEAEMVRRLLRLRDALRQRSGSIGRADEISEARADAMSAPNAHFKRLLTAVPSIASYLDSVSVDTRSQSPATVPRGVEFDVSG